MSKHSKSNDSKTARNEILLKVYADLVLLYPDNTRYVKQYAELLLTMGQKTAAIDMLRQLHRLLLKNGQTGKADALIKYYPMIGVMRAPVHESERIQALLPSFIRNRLWLRMYQKRLREGQYLLHQGEMLDTFYLVCAGELAEFSSAADGEPILLNLIQAGDIVAEDKLLQVSVQQSDIVANKASIVVKLPRKKMMQALLESSLLKKIVLRKMAQRRLLRLISSSPVLQTLPLDMRQQLVRDSCIESYPPGTTLYNAGEKLNHVDLVIEGGADFHWHDQYAVKSLSSLKPGALIGESAVIHHSGCPADLFTPNGVTMLHIAYAAFLNILEAYPPLRKKITDYTEAQRSQLMSKLNELQTQQLP